MYPNLKLAIFKKGIHQNELARVLGLNEALLSKIIRGYRKPSDAQRRLLSTYLGAEETWLFEQYDVAESPSGNGRSNLLEQGKDES